MAADFICTIKDCSKRATSHDMCGMHYQRVKRYGSPDKVNVRVRPTCSAENCSRSHHSHGFCRTHLRRLQRYGDPLQRFGTPYDEQMAWLSDALERETDECIEWPFGKSGRGYGVVGQREGRKYAHRFVCEAVAGPAPSEEHQAAHGCGNSGCVNKRHLRWATPVENMADTLVHGTRNRGERHGIAKLTEDDVRIIRQMIASGHRQRMIAEKFGVQVMAISNINRRVTWGWFE